MQQLRKPRVEGADLDHAAAAQQARMQGGELAFAGCGLSFAHAAIAQLLDSLRGRGGCKIGKPFLQALAHLASGLAGEGDRDNLLRLRARQQSAQDARDQHPSFASAGTGLHHHAARGIASDTVERRWLDLHTVDRVSGALHA